MVSVVASNVPLLVSLLGSCYFLHLFDFRQTKFRVVEEERSAAQDGQVVLGPIPQLSQVPVVQCIETMDVSLKMLPLYYAELSQEGEGHQGVSSAYSQVTCDHLNLSQTGLQLSCYVISSLNLDDHVAL